MNKYLQKPRGPEQEGHEASLLEKKFLLIKEPISDRGKKHDSNEHPNYLSGR